VATLIAVSRQAREDTQLRRQTLEDAITAICPGPVTALAPHPNSLPEI